MKLNNKGFAITSILYAVLILFLSLILAMMMLLANRKMVLDKYKANVREELNSSKETYGAHVQISSDTVKLRIYEDEFMNFDMKSKVSGCLNVAKKVENPEASLCSENEKDVTELVNYNIYDELGNEVLNFSSEVLISEDGFKTEIIKYTTYEKDSNNNYVLAEDGKSLKIITHDLTANKNNIFFVNYYVVDNANILSKASIRNIIIVKYNNYINVLNNYFKISRSEILTYDFLSKAKAYKLETTTENNTLKRKLVADQQSLNYKIYNADDYEIKEFKIVDNQLVYSYCKKNICESNDTYFEEKITSDEKFRVRYFTGTINNLTSEINYAYFNVE